MNTLKNKEISNTDNYQRITNFWIEIYKQERLLHPNYSYLNILWLILKKLRKYCKENNLSFDDYQDFAISNKIHFWNLTKQKLSTIIISSMRIINSSIYNLLTWPYSINSCIELMKIKDKIHVDRRINTELNNTRLTTNKLLRDQNKSWDNPNTQIIWDKNKKSKPFFINYEKINLNKLTEDEKKTIKLLCKRIKTEKINYQDETILTKFLDTLNKFWSIRDDVVHFIMSQCE
jgi:hypothetical protein